MIKLIFKKGTEVEKLHKLRIFDNLRDFVEKKSLEGITFSYEALYALSQFPESHVESIFTVQDNKIEKAIFKIKNPKFENWGYSDAEFHHSRYYNLDEFEAQELIDKTAEKNQKENWMYYIIHKFELQKIAWSDANEIPSFVSEIFEKLGCEPDEIINS